MHLLFKTNEHKLFQIHISSLSHCKIGIRVIVGDLAIFDLDYTILHQIIFIRFSFALKRIDSTNLA